MACPHTSYAPIFLHMTPYIVSVPSKRVVIAYAEWKKLDEAPETTIMADGWTLPSLHFSHLYEAQSASLDLAMVSGSVQPFQAHDVLITEFHGDTEDFSR